MIILIGFGSDYRSLKSQRDLARAARMATARPRRMALADLAKWLSR